MSKRRGTQHRRRRRVVEHQEVEHFPGDLVLPEGFVWFNDGHGNDVPMYAPELVAEMRAACPHCQES